MQLMLVFNNVYVIIGPAFLVSSTLSSKRRRSFVTYAGVGQHDISLRVHPRALGGCES